MAEARMTEEELALLLAEEERQAISFRDSTLADEQGTAIDYYEAEPFGDEDAGRSQIVVPVVAEVCDYMTVSVLRTCISGGHVVEFEASEEDQIEAAAEATEVVSRAFMHLQDGYKVLHDWLQSGLVEKIGIVKTACISESKKRRQRMMVTEDDLAAMDEQGIKPVQATENPDGTFLVVIEQDETKKRYVDYAIPSEEFLFSARTRHEDDADYSAHRSRKSLSELVAMGFARDTVEGLPEHDEAAITDSRVSARWNDETLLANDRTPAMRKVWLREEYIRVDADDDGIAELLKVFRVGNVILDVEEVDEVPFVVFCPFPRAHRMVGNSLADKVMDIQRVRSVLLRQALDGTYLTNAPRMFVAEEGITENTIDDLLTVVPGGIVRGRAGHKPEPLYEPFDPSKSMALMELMVGEQESRTGITRLNQGLDADAMNKTATGMALQSAQGAQIEEFVARNFAEAMARLFAKKLRLMISEGDPIAVKIDGTFKTADPSAWSGDMDVSIRVGLGSGRKDQRLIYRQQLLEMQTEGMQIGLTSPKHIFANVSAMVRDASLGNPLDYFIDPESEEAQQAAQQPQQPDPEALKVQADMQAQQARLQLDEQRAAAELQQSQAEGQAKIEFMREDAAAKAQLAREKADAEFALAERKFQFEASLAERKMELEAELARENAARQHEVSMKTADTKIGSNRPGGSLAE